MGRHVDRGVARGSWLTKWPLQRLRTSRGGSVSQKAGAGDGRGLRVLAPLNVLPQGAVDFGLISPPARRRSRLPAAPRVARAISALGRILQGQPIATNDVAE